MLDTDVNCEVYDLVNECLRNHSPVFSSAAPLGFAFPQLAARLTKG